ncbi:hypothetical protein AX16_000014 [Volvariella volvacea WC 439]|nr:hypothetical protein AX16_000014 [Volvariella volvacea WC 439]
MSSQQSPHEPAHQLAKAIEANRAHQSALTLYAERLQAEIEEVDKLLSLKDAVNLENDDNDLEGEIYIDGAKRPTGLFTASEFLNPASPFFKDALNRTTYVAGTTVHSMKARELEVLAEAVKLENLRLQAHQRQEARGGAELSPVDIEENTEGVNWLTVAEKVSNAANTKRTPEECRIKWLGDRHPIINHGEWTTEETTKLRTLVMEREDGRYDWVDIAKQLGGLHRIKHTWNATYDRRLLEAVQKYGTDNWNLVARYVSEDATAAQCQGRYTRSINPNLKSGAWSAEEDERLKLAVKAYGNSWIDVSVCMSGRTNDQCRERWVDQLSVSSTNTWSGDEDQILLETVASLGSRWKTIALKVGNGKTSSMCRMRFNELKKQKLNASPEPQLQSTNSLGDQQDKNGSVASTSKPRPRPRPRPAKKIISKESAAMEAGSLIGPSASDLEKSSGLSSELMPAQKRGGDNLPPNQLRPVKRQRKGLHQDQESMNETPAMSPARPQPRLVKPSTSDPIHISTSTGTDEEFTRGVALPAASPTARRSRVHSSFPSRQSARLAAKHKEPALHQSDSVRTGAQASP